MAVQVADLSALARRARDLEQLEAALLVFRRVLELDPTNLEAATAIVELAETLDRRGEAVDARLVIVERCIDGQKLEKAARVIAEILALEPGHPQATSYREFVDARLNPEIVLGGLVAAIADPDDEITSPVVVPVEAELEWEARTTGVIAIGNMQALLAGDDPPAASGPSTDSDFDAPARTIAVSGQSAAVAIAGLIQTSPLLRALDSASCARLLGGGEVMQCFADQVVASEGAEGSTLLLLLEGAAAIKRGGKLLEPLAPGDFFGEAALLGDTPRLATLAMIADGMVLEIDRAMLKALSAKHRILVDVLAHVLRRRAIAIRANESEFFRRIPKALLEELAPSFHLHKLRPGDPIPDGGHCELVVGRVDGGVAAEPSWMLALPAPDLAKMIERYPRLREVLAADR